jgi:hypothetical protein
MFNPIQYAGPTRIPPPKMQLRVRKETATHDTANARQFEQWNSDAPVLQGGGPNYNSPQKANYYDMAPLSSRTDRRDFRQSQPFVANGPQLAQNPFFDRYDPTRDPRNMVREVRSVVYEDKEADRGIEESKRLLERGFTSRWVPEGHDEQDFKAALFSYEVMRPKIDSIDVDYRGKGPPPVPVPLPSSIPTGQYGH